ncbi:MAG: TonB-dependent receptor [Proteobacteria bacterium]|nr:TonB-dependent receptor [Pseudomonadota bacterium]
MQPRIKPLAALLALSFAPSAFAIDQLAYLDPVLITATRQETRVSEQLSDVSVIEREEIESAGQSTLEEILSRQPGIEFSANGSFGANSSLYVRGSSGSHVLLLVDGMRMGSATSGSASWNRIPASQIERIEIVRGPASSLYGSDAIGGVIQVFTRQGDGPLSFHGEVGAGTYDTASASGGFSGAQNGWRYALNLATYTTAGFNSKPWTASANKDRDGFWMNSLSGRLAYSFAKGHEAGISVFYSDGESKFDGTGATIDWRNRNSVSSLNAFLKNTLTDFWTSTINVGSSMDDSDELRNGVRNSNFRTDQRLFSWQNDFRTRVGNFLLGAERLEQEVDTTTAYAVRERTNNSLLGGWTLGYEAHRAQVNVRRDDNSQFGDKTTGSLAYGYRFSRNWRANASYGTAFRAPTFNDLYYPLRGGFFGNPNLKPENARNREVALHFETGQQHVSLTWYLNRVENLIVWTNTPNNVGSARLEGITLAYEGVLAGLNVQASYDYLDAKDVDTDRRLARRAQNRVAAAIGQTLGAWEWRVEEQVSDDRMDYPFGQPPKKLGGYSLTNLYGAYRFAKDWSVFARVNNLFDREYVLADTYATPGMNAFIGVRYSPK